MSASISKQIRAKEVPDERTQEGQDASAYNQESLCENQIGSGNDHDQSHWHISAYKPGG
jgi:hypothetical protein